MEEDDIILYDLPVDEQSDAIKYTQPIISQKGNITANNKADLPVSTQVMPFYDYGIDLSPEDKYGLWGDPTVKNVAETAIGFVPILGTIQEGINLYNNPSWANAGWFALSLATDLPFLSWAKGIKLAKAMKPVRAAEKSAKAAESTYKAATRNFFDVDIDPDYLKNLYKDYKHAEGDVLLEWIDFKKKKRAIDLWYKDMKPYILAGGITTDLIRESVLLFEGFNADIYKDEESLMSTPPEELTTQQPTQQQYQQPLPPFKDAADPLPEPIEKDYFINHVRDYDNINPFMAPLIYNKRSLGGYMTLNTKDRAAIIRAGVAAGYKKLQDIIDTYDNIVAL